MNTGKSISDAILGFAKEENKTLETLNLGIFYIPELAFAYQMGKLIALSGKEYLSADTYRWVRETDLGNWGPTDLIFLNEDKNLPSYAIEFKLDDTYHAYTADIKKLKMPFKQPWDSYTWKKYFCALKWVLSEKQGHTFMETMRTQFAQAELVDFYLFETIVNAKPKQYCLYSFWEIN